MGGRTSDRPNTDVESVGPRSTRVDVRNDGKGPNVGCER